MWSPSFYKMELLRKLQLFSIQPSNFYEIDHNDTLLLDPWTLSMSYKMEGYILDTSTLTKF